ncbi:hypothetical protein [Microbacterium sp. LWH7-1.2]|uniref:hypothetical protein n=1 Tax=Microbacterium sp. LWH7-1.2 TaxID=3135257 RepID=UPI003139296C
MTLGADRSPVANGRADLQHVTGAQRFAIGETDLLFDGEPFRVLAGALHYFRAHPGQWAGTCVLGCPGGGRGGRALATLEAFKVRAAGRTLAPKRHG